MTHLSRTPISVITRPRDACSPIIHPLTVPSSNLTFYLAIIHFTNGSSSTTMGRYSANHTTFIAFLSPIFNYLELKRYSWTPLSVTTRSLHARFTHHPLTTHLHGSPPPDLPHGCYLTLQRQSASLSPCLTSSTLHEGVLATRPLPDKPAMARGKSDNTGLITRTPPKAADTRTGHREGRSMDLKETSEARQARTHGAPSVSFVSLPPFVTRLLGQSHPILHSSCLV